jgi:SOS response regulatory protein OraA/RecX
MGRERLSHELLAQGLQPVTVARALDLVYRELSERDLARTLLSRWVGPGREASQVRKAALLRRYGFSDETIEAVLGALGAQQAMGDGQ